MNSKVLTQRIESLWERILRVNPYTLWGLLIALVLLKTGFRSSSLGVSANFVPALLEMPKATSQFQSGFSPFWLAYILQIQTTRAWMLMTTLILVVALVLVVPLVKRRFPGNVQLGIIIIASLPVLSTQFSWLGMYDPFIFLGLLIWGLGRSPLTWITGGFIAASANPEQVTVAALLAVIASLTLRIKPQRKQALYLLATSISAVGISQFWFFLSGNASSRAGEINDLLEPSLYAFSKFWPMYLWAVFGAFWVIALLTIASLRSKSAGVLSIFVITGIPLLAAALTLDGFRVIALVALPITLLIAGSFMDSISSHQWIRSYLAVGMIMLIIFTPPAEIGWPSIGPLIYDFLARIT